MQRSHSSTTSTSISQPSKSLTMHINGSRLLTSNPAKNVLRTKILFLGLRRSGKSSIQQVLFHDMPPKQTFYLDTTMGISKHNFDSIIPFEIWDVPGGMPIARLGVPLSYFDAIVFVIDIQASYQHSLPALVQTLVTAFKEKPEINFDVFVHKAEALSEEYRIESFRQIQQRVLEDLLDISMEYEQLPVIFHLTSVYDQSAHESFSQVLHKLIDSMSFVEGLLNVFCTNSQASKAFLFDTKTRLYVASDSSPVDTATHNLCCDYVQMLNSFGSLYQLPDTESIRPQLPPPTPQSPLASPKSVAKSSPSSSGPSSPPMRPARIDRTDSYFSTSTKKSHASQPASNNSTLTPNQRTRSSPNASPSAAAAASTPTSPHGQSHAPAASRSNNASNGSNGSNGSHSSGTSGSSASSANTVFTPQLFYPSASTTITSPSNSSHPRTLTFHVITPQLALLALLPASTFEQRRGLIEYNVVFFREGVREICEVERRRRIQRAI